MTMPLFPSPLSQPSKATDSALELAKQGLKEVLAKLQIAALRGGAHKPYNEVAERVVEECYKRCEEVQQPTTAPVSDVSSRTPNSP